MKFTNPNKNRPTIEDRLDEHLVKRGVLERSKVNAQRQAEGRRPIE